MPGACMRSRKVARPLEDRRGEILVALGIEAAAQTELVDVLVELHVRQQTDQACVELGRILQAGAFKIDPIGRGVQPRIAGAQRLAQASLVRAKRVAFIGAGAHRTVPQSIDQVVAQREREHVALVADIAEAPGR